MTTTPDTRAQDGALQRLRRRHELQVLDLLRERGPMTRQDLIVGAGLSRTTLYEIILTLLGDGVVDEQRVPGPPRRGRPESVISLNPKSASVAGIELGRDHIAVAVANFAHQITASSDSPLPPDSDDRLASLAVAALNDALGSADVGRSRLAAIVIGVPLSVEIGDNEFSDGRRAEIAEAFAAEFALTPTFDNNARLVALAEAQWGAGADTEDLIYLHLGQGVGGGLVMRGHLVDGPTGRAGEPGHLSMDPYGPACWCGGRGCLERYVALPELFAAAGTEDLTTVRLGPVSPVLDHALDRLAQAISSALTTLDISTVVIGGAGAAIPGLAAALRDRVGRIAPRHISSRLQVRRAELGALGSARGGVALGLRDSRMLAEYHTGRVN